jgi:hypothetical protein
MAAQLQPERRVPWWWDWHVYGVRWAQDRSEFHVDGSTRWTITPADRPSRGLWAFNRPFFLLFNIAVVRWGCSGAPSPCPDPAQFPAAMLVDWVRVYSTPPCCLFARSADAPAVGMDGRPCLQGRTA